METIQTGWIAVKEQPEWDKNNQISVVGTWGEIVQQAKKLMRITNKEVRVSTTYKFNNQGYYFHPNDR